MTASRARRGVERTPSAVAAASDRLGRCFDVNARRSFVGFGSIPSVGWYLRFSAHLGLCRAHAPFWHALLCGCVSPSIDGAAGAAGHCAGCGKRRRRKTDAVDLDLAAPAAKERRPLGA